MIIIALKILIVLQFLNLLEFFLLEERDIFLIKKNFTTLLMLSYD